jgi:hypothetical protein
MSKEAMVRFALAFLFVVLLVGCGSTATDIPTGVFSARSGIWELTLDDDGNSTFSEDGIVEVSGTFSIRANELTWETDSYCDLRGAGKATYTWTFEDNILLLQVKGEDRCFDRLDVLDNIPYQKED